MAIYQVNSYSGNPTFFVENQSVIDSVNPDNFIVIGNLVIGSKQDAEAKLKEVQKNVLEYEALRFSVCATFVNGNDTTWREIKDSDPEDTICQVFNHVVGQYQQYSNKTEANAAMQKLKEEFLALCNLDKVIELSELPTPPEQPISTGTQTL